MFEREKVLFLTNFILNNRVKSTLDALKEAKKVESLNIKELFDKNKKAIFDYRNQWKMTDEERILIINNEKIKYL